MVMLPPAMESDGKTSEALFMRNAIPLSINLLVFALALDDILR